MKRRELESHLLTRGGSVISRGLLWGRCPWLSIDELHFERLLMKGGEKLVIPVALPGGVSLNLMNGLGGDEGDEGRFDDFSEDFARALLSVGGFGDVASAGVLLGTISQVWSCRSELGVAEGASGELAAAMAKGWRRASGIRASITPPAMFQGVLKNQAILTGSIFDISRKEQFSRIVNAIGMEIDADMLYELSVAIDTVAEIAKGATRGPCATVNEVYGRDRLGKTAWSDLELARFLAPELKEYVSQGELQQAGFSKGAAKRMRKPGFATRILSLYSKAVESMAGWEVLSSLVEMVRPVASDGTLAATDAPRSLRSSRWALMDQLIQGSEMEYSLVGVDLRGFLKEVRQTVATSGNDAYRASGQSYIDQSHALALEVGGVALKFPDMLIGVFLEDIAAESYRERVLSHFRSPLTITPFDHTKRVTLSPGAIPDLNLWREKLIGGGWGGDLEVVVPSLSKRLFDGGGDAAAQQGVAEPEVMVASPEAVESTTGFDLLVEPTETAEFIPDESPSARGSSYDPDYIFFGASSEPEPAPEPPASPPNSAGSPFSFTGGGAPKKKSKEESSVFLAPPPSAHDVPEPTGALGVSSEALLSIFEKYVTFRHRDGRLVFGIPRSGRLMDAHAYVDNGEKISAYVNFVREKYSEGFAPRTQKIIDLPKRGVRPIDEDLLISALGLFEAGG